MQGWFHGHGIYHTADGMKYEGLLLHTMNVIRLQLFEICDVLFILRFVFFNIDFILILESLIVAVVRKYFAMDKNVYWCLRLVMFALKYVEMRQDIFKSQIICTEFKRCFKLCIKVYCIRKFIPPYFN